MLVTERHRAITEIVTKEGKVTVTTLAQRLEVSKETIRRDLSLLEKQGMLERSHGGAVPVIKRSMDLGSSFNQRRTENPDSKIAIAREALKLIHAGDCILLDSSTSSWFLAEQLPDIELTVLTNSLHVLTTLANKRRIRVICLGGEYSGKYEAFTGVFTEQAVAQFNIDTLFFSCHGLSRDGEVRESNEVHARTKQAMLKVANKKVLLLDKSKYFRRSFTLICDANELDIMIVDDELPKEFIQEMAWNGVKVLPADHDTSALIE